MKYASVNPSNIPVGTGDISSNEFAALVHVKSSRYVKYEYTPESGLAPKIGIEWVMGTTKGNTFTRVWSIGVPWDGNEGAISADGKQCAVSIKRNSDAFYLLEKAIEAGYPAEKLDSDISVFDGETFFMATDGNPRSRGSKRKIYPKRYHSEGWDAALEAAVQRRAAKEAQSAAPAYTAPTASYTPPAVVQHEGVMQAAGEILVAILTGDNGSVARNELPRKVSQYIDKRRKETGENWDDNFKKEVAIALWDITQLTSVVGSDPRLTISGDTVKFK